jgi:hypothetical protein
MTTAASLPSSPTFSDGDYTFLDDESIIQEITPSIDTTVDASACFTTLSNSDDDSFGPAIFPPKKNKLKMFCLGFVDSDTTSTNDDASDDEGSLTEDDQDDLDDYDLTRLKTKMWWVLQDLVEVVERKKCIKALTLVTLHHNATEEPNKLNQEAKFAKAMLKICLVGAD